MYTLSEPPVSPGLRAGEKRGKIQKSNARKVDLSAGRWQESVDMYSLGIVWSKIEYEEENMRVLHSLPLRRDQRESREETNAGGNRMGMAEV